MTEKTLVESLRQLGKYSEFEPNYFFLAADRIEELSEKPIKTNYDRIRNMSVEELASKIVEIVNCKMCPVRNNCEPWQSCENEMIKYLESEVDTE